MSQELHWRFYLYNLPVPENCEAGSIIILGLQMRRQRHMEVQLFASTQSWQAEQLGLNFDL